MYDRAMDKLRDEMAKTKSKAVGMVGEIVTLYLMADEANAEKILRKEKTLSGAYAAMKSVAQKGRRECIDCDEAAEIFRELYQMGFDDPQTMHEAPHHAQIGRPDEVLAARTPVLRYKK